MSSALANLFYHLSLHPHVQQKLYEEVKENFNDEIIYEELMQNEYLDAVINEVLRLNASFLLITRTAAVVSWRQRTKSN